MKTENRLNYSAEFKTKVVFELLLAKTSIQELSRKYQLSIQTIDDWKKQLFKSSSVIFGTKRTSTKKQREEIERLKQKRASLQRKIDDLQNKKDYTFCQSRYDYVPLFQVTLPANRIKNLFLPRIS